MTRPPPGSLQSLAAATVLALVLLGLLALVDPGGGHADAAAGTDSQVDQALLDELADGGEVLLMRHAVTDRSQTDADPTARGGCDQQRNLSAEGVQQATEIGLRLRSLGVPLGEVYASPFCRTVDTAIALAGDAAQVTETDALVSLTSATDQEGQNAITGEATALIDRALEGDAVTVMVTHTQNIEALVSQTVEEGDAVVLGREAGGVTVLDVVPAAAW